MTANTTPKYAVGDRVTVVVDTPNNEPVNGTIRVIQDVPGKLIGVELDAWAKYAHSLDGVVEEREDENGGFVVGKGWWTRAENIDKL